MLYKVVQILTSKYHCKSHKIASQYLNECNPILWLCVSGCVCVHAQSALHCCTKDTNKPPKAIIVSCRGRVKTMQGHEYREKMLQHNLKPTYTQNVSLEYYTCHYNMLPSHSTNTFRWQVHTLTYTHPRNYWYIPKSLGLLELGATIKTIVALVIILKILPSDWSRHIQSRGQILFIKRAKTSAQLLLLKAPTLCVSVCVCARWYMRGTLGKLVCLIITWGRASFQNKLFLN